MATRSRRQPVSRRTPARTKAVRGVPGVPRPSRPSQGNWEEAIGRYLDQVQRLNKEQARSHRFAMLLQEICGLQPGFVESYSKGIESTLQIREKDRILKGQADNLFGNIIIEFEPELPRNQIQAENQLRRYVAILWSEEPSDHRTPYLCIATDGIRFTSYTPTLSDPSIQKVDPSDVLLALLEECDWTRLQPHEAFYWLDRYLMRQQSIRPTTESIVHDFGMKSHAFQTSQAALLPLWRELRGKSSFSVIYEGWEKYLRIVYGTSVADEELFIRHTYLATLARLMSWRRLSPTAEPPTSQEMLGVLEGEFFKAQGIENFIEEDFFSWIARPDAATVVLGVVRGS